MLEPSAVITRSPRAEYRDVGEGEGGVLLRMDTAAYHGINDVGSLIWTLLDGITFGDLLLNLRARLTDLPAAFETEISDFVQTLVDRGLVSVAANSTQQPTDVQPGSGLS